MIDALIFILAHLTGLLGFDAGHPTPFLLTSAVPVMLRFSDLKARGIVNNWPSLERWKRLYGFPPGRLIAPNTRAWTEDEIAEFLASRPTAPKPVSPRSGRRKTEASLQK